MQLTIDAENWLTSPMRFALLPSVRALYVDLMALASRNGGSVVSAGELGGEGIPSQIKVDDFGLHLHNPLFPSFCAHFARKFPAERRLDESAN